MNGVAPSCAGLLLVAAAAAAAAAAASFPLRSRPRRDIRIGRPAMSASAALLAAALAAGTAEGMSVLSRLAKRRGASDSNSDSNSWGEADGGGGESALASTSPSASVASLLLPSAAYGVASLPLSAVGGSPGPAIVAAISPFDDEDEPRGAPPPPPSSAAFSEIAGPAPPRRSSAPFPPSLSAIRDERSGPVRLGGGRVLRPEESAAAGGGGGTSFEEAVPLLSDHRRRRRAGVRPLRRAPNLEPGPHSASPPLPSAEDARNMAFDAAHASMRAPSSSVLDGEPRAAERRTGGLRRPRRSSPSPSPPPENVAAGGEPGDSAAAGVSRPMRERAEEMRAARARPPPPSPESPPGVAEGGGEGTSSDRASPPPTAEAAFAPVAEAAVAAAPRAAAVAGGGVESRSAASAGLARYVAALDGRPLPAPAAEALRRVRTGLVGLAAAAAIAGYEAALAEAKGDGSERRRAAVAEGADGAEAVERYLASADARAPCGTALRLVSATDRVMAAADGRGAATTRTLPVVLPGSAAAPWPSESPDGPSAPAHWRLGSSPDGTWTDAPVTPRWLFRPRCTPSEDGGGSGDGDGKRRSVILVEADLSRPPLDSLSGVIQGGQGALAPETVRLAARCLAAAAWRKGLGDGSDTNAGDVEVVRVLIGSGPPAPSVVEKDVVYIDGAEAVAAAVVRTLDGMRRDDSMQRCESKRRDDKEGRHSTEGDISKAGAEKQNSTSAITTTTTMSSTPSPGFSSDPLGAVGSLVRRAGAGTASAAASAVGAAGAAARGAGAAAAGGLDAAGAAARRGLRWLGGGGGGGSGGEREALRLYADEAATLRIRPALEREGWNVAPRGASFDGIGGAAAAAAGKEEEENAFVLVMCPTDDETLDVASSLLAARPSLASAGRLAAVVECPSSGRTLRALAAGSTTDPPRIPGDDDGEEEEGGSNVGVDVGVVCTRSVREGALLRAREWLARGATTEEARWRTEEELGRF